MTPTERDWTIAGEDDVRIEGIDQTLRNEALEITATGEAYFYAIRAAIHARDKLREIMFSNHNPGPR